MSLLHYKLHLCRLLNSDQCSLVAQCPGENLALYQPAIQSTNFTAGFPPDQGLASLATDGSLINDWKPVYPCTHTDMEDQPWWAVDLGAVTNVGHIKVTTRSYCCSKCQEIFRSLVFSISEAYLKRIFQLRCFELIAICGWYV